VRWLLAVLLSVGVACAHAPAPEKAVSGFRFEVQPPDSELTVDGQVVGPVSSVPMQDGVFRLDPGVHQMSLKRKGYQTWRAEVALGSQVEALKVNLVKR
jgi:hypothetical protein